MKRPVTTLLRTVALAATISFACGVLCAADKEEVKDGDKLRFDQDKVAANMRELEDRMLKLADLLRDAKPDDSARLLLGVENAREELILEQMQVVSEMLESVDLSQATAEQKEILDKLHQLKQLLLNVDLDLKIKLEQLKKIANARKKLAELIAKEENQKAATDDAGARGNDPSPLAANEQRNQKAGQNLQQQIKKIGGSGKASDSVGSASGSMGKAAQSLSAGKPGDASGNQQEALDALKQAEQELAELKEKVQQEAEASARQRVTELLNEMLERQTSVKDATVAAIPKVTDGDLEIAGLLTRLAKVEDEIVDAADECIEICDLTEFSFVLPAAMRDIRERMINVRSTLEQAEANEPLVQQEEYIIADLKELIDAMKQAGKPGSPKISNSKCGRCDNRNKLIAEVKMLLFMQKAVSRKTKEIHAAELAGNITEQSLETQTGQMRDQQDKIHEVTQRLRELTNPEFVNGDGL
ncbi:MAG: hypothetical protein KDB27_14575 [Planctomycetales bacterium]|nr:hypothetical protein [Planctomycetales bacterium]